MTERLALLGGEPVTRREWPFYNTITEAEKNEVMEVLDSGVLSAFTASSGPHFLGGPKVRRLEKAWNRAFDTPYSVSMNSATSCLYAALVACGVGSGHEVIVPQLGMCAAATMVLLTGARVVFADCDPHSMLLDPASVEAKITPRTRAILPVHLAGQPCDMDSIMHLAARHGLMVVEDNAQAPGARFKDRLAGTIGHVGCFSLNCHKVIQCGEGGVACTADPELAMRLRLVRNHGEKYSREFAPRHTDIRGLNLRMTELEAAVAFHQLAKLPALNARTVALCQRLTSALDLPGLIPPRPLAHRDHVYYIYHWEYREESVGLPPDRFAEAVQAEGFPVYAHYGYRISDLPPFQEMDHKTGAAGGYPGTDQAIRNSLWTMFVRPHLAEEDIDLLALAMAKVYRHRRDLA